VPYFTAVVAKAGSAWRARDVEVDEYDSLDDLADALRSVAVDDEPVLAVIEHEDEWFAVVRVDGDDEPRLFVSDLLASAHSHYGHILASAADVDAEEELGSGEDDDDDDAAADDAAAAADDADYGGAGGRAPGPGVQSDLEGPGSEENAEERGESEVEDVEPDRPVLAAWAGELELLDDLGFSARALRAAAEQRGDDPAGVLADLGDAAGFGELLEALR